MIVYTAARVSLELAEPFLKNIYRNNPEEGPKIHLPSVIGHGSAAVMVMVQETRGGPDVHLVAWILLSGRCCTV